MRQDGQAFGVRLPIMKSVAINQAVQGNTVNYAAIVSVFGRSSGKERPSLRSVELVQQPCKPKSMIGVDMGVGGAEGGLRDQNTAIDSKCNKLHGHRVYSWAATATKSVPSSSPCRVRHTCPTLVYGLVIAV